MIKIAAQRGQNHGKTRTCQTGDGLDKTATDFRGDVPSKKLVKLVYQQRQARFRWNQSAEATF